MRLPDRSESTCAENVRPIFEIDAFPYKVLIFGFDRAAAGGFLSAQHGVDDGRGAAHA